MRPDATHAPAAAHAPAHLQRLPDPKRALDLILGSLLLVLAAPALAVAGALLALRGGPGAVFSREYGTGLHGIPFTVRSLRTRRFRLDLLSRLPHVLSGRMSLVGPAPLPPGTRGAAPAWRRSVRPGLTGLAQVRRDSRLPWNERALLDQHYVEHCRLGLDLLLLVRTPAALAATRGPRVPRAARRAAPRKAPRAGRLPLQPRAQRARTVTDGDTDHRTRRYIAAG
jgi:lipopolysaccharide/colanic/teichoic acid biosynthesis glycosyltransferase